MTMYRLALSISDHENVEVRILHGGSKGTRTLQRGQFALFKDLLRGIPWDRALGKKGV